MKNRGNCGLKQARYETSCSGCACRCLAVQNSFSNTGTPPVSDRRVALPKASNPASNPANLALSDADGDVPSMASPSRACPGESGGKQRVRQAAPAQLTAINAAATRLPSAIRTL